MYGTPSYMTMNVHHFSTVFAIIISYLSNLEEFGILVLILSDSSDAILNFAKTCRDTNMIRKSYIDVVFAVMVIVWLYTRTFTLPICFFQGSSKFASLSPWYLAGKVNEMEMFLAAKYGIYFIIFNVYSICMLNMYWTGLIMELLYDKLFKKGAAYHSDYEKATIEQKESKKQK
jgi:hypothetical protein